MSHDYTMGLLINDHVAELQHEADQERLARLARQGQARKPRWWERLMLFHTGSDAARIQAAGQSASQRPVSSGPARPAAPRPAAPIAAGTSPC